MCTRLVVQMSCHNMSVHASACALPMSAPSPASCSSFGLIDAALLLRREAQDERRADTVHRGAPSVTLPRPGISSVLQEACASGSESFPGTVITRRGAAQSSPRAPALTEEYNTTA
ncbi:hypothetical protein OJAV_G00127480 [Oryzias javanicus]|uniref:Uncharacterized protein n=1 Tax=Oryzias javanicus TaxID=123683 RepID=A0A3S2PYI4_ORYJA|nr:hypothetical protein OJAV_G00127480 [Oryzias javanicus]